MRKFLITLAFLIPVFSNSAGAGQLHPIRVSIIRTGSVTIPEKFAFSGGSLFKAVTLNHSAVLVDHPRGRILFDTGLGEKIDQQFSADMPWWGYALFSYKKGVTAFKQLQLAKERLPDRILLSHVHWDHASALADFSGVPVWIGQQELDFLKKPHPGSVFSSQFDRLDGRIRAISLERGAVGNYARSFDMFGDGRVRLIGMPGHTPGSMGLLVRTSSGRKYFFIGDVVWSAAALDNGSPKFWIPRAVVDDDATAARAAVVQLQKFRAANPEVIIVPAHDGSVQDSLDYFPKWVN